MVLLEIIIKDIANVPLSRISNTQNTDSRVSLLMTPYMDAYNMSVCLSVPQQRQGADSSPVMGFLTSDVLQ